MRHALITDVHGDLEGLTTALRMIGEHDVDRVISLGDVLDCLISSRSRGRRLRSLDQVTVWSPAMEGLLEDVLLIRGNQEERIAGHLPGDAVPAEVARLLAAPDSHRTDFATYCHGHLLSWTNPLPDLWCPLHEDFPGVALVYGHHHRNALFEVPRGRRTWSATREVEITSGVPIPLDRERRYLVNVGPARGPSPSWALIDETASTVTYHCTQSRYKD
ncbi:metallophosphoesterase family protein [Streptosporangium sp. NPDC051022]|uniref:metallophosphoesterase family protein n=1 Tax=Streptosporangium sp. NPDC051022 TaxID=3155752 RepID=UPI003441160C